MKTVRLDVADREDVTRRVLRVYEEKQGPRITFATPELPWRVLTVKRVFPFDAVHVDFTLRAA